MTAEVVAGRYRLVERVGVGGMSEVWAASDLELERSVALKLLAPDADRARFEREAQAVARLSHPHICRLYDFGDADGRPYMVLELLDGGSLDDRLRDGRPLPDADTARIAAEVASALGYAHAEGVLHRDVKPTNVLFDSEGNAKIADFGIARVLDEPTLTEAGTLLGTAAYISPEQSRGEVVTPATDVYAFGAVLFQMLTGRPPFEGTDALEVAAMHATREPPPISSLRPDAPPELAAVAGAALAKNPEERPADGDALVALLTAGPPSLVEAATEVIPPRRSTSRIGPREVAIAGALLLLAVVGVGAAVLATPDTSQAPVTGTTGQPSTDPPNTTIPVTAPTTASTESEQTTSAATTQLPPPPPPATTTPTSTETPTTAPATTATLPATTTDVTTTTETTETGTTTTPSG